jgi:hypothetical protein
VNGVEHTLQSDARLRVLEDVPTPHEAPSTRLERLAGLSYELSEPAAFESTVSRSIGIGKTIVELFADPISSSVWR